MAGGQVGTLQLAHMRMQCRQLQLTIPPSSSPNPTCRLQLYGHGTELFSKDEATLAVLQRHLLRSAGAECVDALLRYLAADSAAVEAGQEGEGGGDPALTDASAGPLSAAQRAAVLKDLPPDVKPAASAAVEKLGGASLEVRLAAGWQGHRLLARASRA